jgi:hypothetical protein
VEERARTSMWWRWRRMVRVDRVFT